MIIFCFCFPIPKYKRQPSYLSAKLLRDYNVNTEVIEGDIFIVAKAESEDAVEGEDFVVMYNIRMENWAKRIIIISKRQFKKTKIGASIRACLFYQKVPFKSDKSCSSSLVEQSLSFIEVLAIRCSLLIHTKAEELQRMCLLIASSALQSLHWRHTH